MANFFKNLFPVKASSDNSNILTIVSAMTFVIMSLLSSLNFSSLFVGKTIAFYKNL